MKRQVVLDTETTGLEPTQGHRIIEVAGVELLGGKRTGKTVRYFVNPERKIPKRATEIHGITDDQVVDKPTFFQIGLELLDFLNGADLVIHNAPFDVKFLNNEFKRAGFGAGVIKKHCTVVDTLRMAREIWPRKPNSLDAVCQRVGVGLSGRTHHGALLDAELLTGAYLIMVTLTGKEAKKETDGQAKTDTERAPVGREARWGQWWLA